MPYSDTYANFVQDHELNLWRLSAKRLGEQIPRDLRLAGYDFDVIDGSTPLDSIVRRHKVVVVAGSHHPSAPDVQRLRDISETGVKVILIDADWIPGAIHATPDQLIQALSTELAPDVTTGSAVVGAIHHRLADADLYFVANTSADTASFCLQPRTRHDTWERWALGNGTTSHGTGRIEGRLALYEAYIYVTSWETDILISQPKNTDLPREQQNVPTVHLTEWTFQGRSGPQRVTVPHIWFNDDDIGTATYTVEINLEGASLPSHLVFEPSGASPTPTAARGQAYQATRPTRSEWWPLFG